MEGRGSAIIPTLGNFTHYSSKKGERRMQKSLHIDPGKCTGCLQCESA
ncbi:MAG: ferredoxin, partial [Gammaproteobacteria bacterium]